MVKVKVNNIPPYKQSPASKTEGENQRIRKSFLKNEIEKEMINKDILVGNVKLIIRYKRGKCKSDSANIIGGICDTLNKIVYNDDFQVKEIDYKEEKSDEEEYEVEVIPL